MTTISVSQEQVFPVAADIEDAYDFFSKPERFRVAMEGVIRCDALDDQCFRWLLKEQTGQGVRFQPDYTVRFQSMRSQGDETATVQWDFVEGNLENEGRIRIEQRPTGGCDIHYHERVAPDLPVTPLLLKLVSPLVKRELQSGMQHFMERSQALLSYSDSDAA